MAASKRSRTAPERAAWSSNQCLNHRILKARHPKRRHRRPSVRAVVGLVAAVAAVEDAVVRVAAVVEDAAVRAAAVADADGVVRVVAVATDVAAAMVAE